MDPNSGSSFSHSQENSASLHDQEQSKFIIDGDNATLPEPGKPLPETYGDNRLVMMARDPLCLFAYWDVTPDRVQAMRNEVGPDLWQKGQATLRVYDVTGIGGDLVASRFFDVSVTFDARRWYVHVPEKGHSYVIELGFKFPDGRFLALLRSNRVSLPSGSVSSQTDSQWMIVNVGQWEQMFEVVNNSARGSVEIARMMAQRWEFLKSVFSGSSLWKKDI